MSEKQYAGASFPLTVLVLGVAIYLTIGLVTMNVPESVASPGPRFFPTIITIVAYAVVLVLIVQSMRQFLADRRSVAVRRPSELSVSGGLVSSDATISTADSSESGDGKGEDEQMNWKMISIVVISFIAFILLLNVLGWLLSAALLVFGVATGLGAKSMFTSAFVSLTMSAIVQLAFVGGLGLPLPTGFLGGF
ncbi:tripartite tricarboxylate transporter TctB family protein [Brevibacterium sediminis]|uniref:tripartite tricarboxylate transporter TctB family protein n=2 Tax=Brevibacterium sediminis TaxID=1857024 RepID=UPI00366EBEED